MKTEPVFVLGWVLVDEKGRLVGGIYYEEPDCLYGLTAKRVLVMEVRE